MSNNRLGKLGVIGAGVYSFRTARPNCGVANSEYEWASRLICSLLTVVFGFAISCTGIKARGNSTLATRPG
jgi:hypothetical protein